MEQHPFGNTGIMISSIGYGAGQIGNDNISEKEVEALLNTVLDSGITLIDTARGYGLSEERIGRYLAHRRHEYILSTKVGYDILGTDNWSYDCIITGVDAALTRLQTDYLDIVHLHSCPLETLQSGEAIEALNHTVAQGKVRVAAYAGDDKALAYAVASQQFQSIMASLNLFDQQLLQTSLPQAKAQGLGFIAKRPIGNAPWRFVTQPHGDYSEVYWLRSQQMQLDQLGIDWLELALRYTLYTDGVDSSIIGTTNINHLQQNIALAAKGPLPTEIRDAIQARFRQHDNNWVGQI